VSKIQRIPRPRQLFPELAALFIEWKRANLRATRTFRLTVGHVPVWVTGSLAGMLGIMLTISLFFIPQSRPLEAAATSSPPEIVPAILPPVEPQPTLAANLPQSQLVARFLKTHFPFTFDETKISSRNSSLVRSFAAQAMRDAWDKTRIRSESRNQFMSYLLRAYEFRSTWPGLSANDVVSLPLPWPSLRSLGIVIEKSTVSGTPHEPLTYEIVVRNLSSAPIEKISIRERISSLARVTDVVPEAGIAGNELVWNLEALAPTASRTFLVTIVPELEGQIDTLTRVIPASHVAAVVNVHPKTEARPLNPPQPPQETIRQPAGTPDLKLTYTETRPLKQGDTLSMIFEVKNVGTAAANDVVLFVRLSGEFEHRYGEFVNHRIGTLPPGQVRRALLQATARDPGNAHLDASLTMQGTEKESRELKIPIRSNPLPQEKMQPVVQRPIFDQNSRLTVLDP